MKYVICLPSAQQSMNYIKAAAEIIIIVKTIIIITLMIPPVCVCIIYTKPHYNTSIIIIMKYRFL